MSEQEKQKRGAAFTPVIGSVYRYRRENIGTIMGCLLLGILFAFASENFTKISNWTNVLRQMSTNSYLSVGIMLVIVLGGIDLSVGFVLAVSGVISASLITNNGIPVGAATLLGCLAGTAIGLLNGLTTAFTDMPPLVVAIATINIGRGVAYLCADGNSVRVPNDTFEAISPGYLGPVPLSVIYMVVVLVFMYFLMNKSKMGSHIYAVDGSRQAAVYSGTNARKVIILVYTFNGLAASWAGIVLTSRMASGQPATGVGHEADAVATVMLGGTSMTGGAGGVGGMVLGVLLIGMLNNGLNLLGVNSFWQYVVKRAVILVAVYIDILRKRRERFQQEKEVMLCQ